MAGILSLIGVLGPILLEIIRFMIAKGMMKAATSRKFIDAIESYQKESGNFSVKMRNKYAEMVRLQLEAEANESGPPRGVEP